MNLDIPLFILYALPFSFFRWVKVCNSHFGQVLFSFGTEKVGVGHVKQVIGWYRSICTWILLKKERCFCIFFAYFQNVIFCEMLWLTSKKLHVWNRLSFCLQKNQFSWVIMWFRRSIFTAWKNVSNFCVANFYLIFS